MLLSIKVNISLQHQSFELSICAVVRLSSPQHVASELYKMFCRIPFVCMLLHFISHYCWWRKYLQKPEVFFLIICHPCILLPSYFRGVVIVHIRGFRWWAVTSLSESGRSRNGVVKRSFYLDKHGRNQRWYGDSQTTASQLNGPLIKCTIFFLKFWVLQATF